MSKVTGKVCLSSFDWLIADIDKLEDRARQMNMIDVARDLRDASYKATVERFEHYRESSLALSQSGKEG